MKKYTYMGDEVPFLIPVCVYEGYTDGKNNVTQLYRRPSWKIVGWFLGNIVWKLLNT